MRHAFLLPFWIALLASGVFAQTPTPTVDLPGMDLNKDGTIDGRDVLLFLSGWGERDIYIPNWTATVTPAPSITPTLTPSLTTTLSLTDTLVPTLTLTFTPSPTGTPSVTMTPSGTTTNTPTPSLTLTPTQTPSITDSPTKTATRTLTQTLTPTQSATATPTRTGTRTLTPSSTKTPTVTPTFTITQTPTPTGLAHFREEIEEEFRNSTTFDLEREVARVMLDPRVPDVTQPQWKRESYQAIIDAARAHRLAIDYPYDDGVTHAALFPIDVVTIEVPLGSGNYPGKTTYRIRYVSDKRWSSKQDIIWGDNEDIIYVTGSCVFNQLRILPGTIVLVSSFQNDLYGKALTGGMVEELHNAFELSPGPGGEIQSLVRTPEYTNGFSTLYIGIMLARGTEASPIMICSDSSVTSTLSLPTPYDWRSYGISKGGVIDYCIILNNEHGGSESNEGLTSRTLFHDHLATGRNGSGWVIGCYFGDSWNECIDAPTTNSTHEFTILYNDFESTTRAAGITIPGNPLDNLNEGPTIARIENNTFNNRLGVGADIHNADSLISIHHNSFIPFATYIINVSEYGMDARYNWWSSNNVNEIGSTIITDGNDPGYGPGIINFQPFLTSPDSDRDGLTDEEEVAQGTDPNVMDTDGDFCIDGLEVNQYQTLPLNPDTDGDGIPDGIEVFRGTDPKVK